MDWDELDEYDQIFSDMKYTRKMVYALNKFAQHLVDEGYRLDKDGKLKKRDKSVPKVPSTQTDADRVQPGSGCGESECGDNVSGGGSG